MRLSRTTPRTTRKKPRCTAVPITSVNSVARFVLPVSYPGKSRRPRRQGNATPADIDRRCRNCPTRNSHFARSPHRHRCGPSSNRRWFCFRFFSLLLLTADHGQPELCLVRDEARVIRLPRPIDDHDPARHASMNHGSSSRRPSKRQSATSPAFGAGRSASAWGE